ncbi:hypothetical protein [Streptomyces sp. NPDC003247]|uniref:hypothetical protein n=1 Tax=Streptomyces sp. NPDC003247 TaxID=3364677 RepID=UPI0036807516
MLTERQGERLPARLDAVRQGDLPSRHTLAAGIDRDRDAVIAGLTLPWNSGVVEGHANRIKVHKRRMFGPGRVRQARGAAEARGESGTRKTKRRVRAVVRPDGREPAGTAVVLQGLMADRAGNVPAAGGSILDLLCTDCCRQGSGLVTRVRNAPPRACSAL